MSNITSNLDSLYPEYEWWDTEFEWFVEDLATRGINIGTDMRRTTKGKTYTKPAISFSGFYSQGDGLAFDATIDWPKFFEAHPEFAQSLPNWYLLLVANPNDILAGVHRYNMGNTLTTDCDWNSPNSYEIEKGFFAGMNSDDLDLSIPELEEYIKDVCEKEAHKMYKSLEATYEGECEFMREQEVEQLIEVNLAAVRAALATWPEEHDEVDLEDLRELGLAERSGLTEKGKELLNGQAQ